MCLLFCLTDLYFSVNCSVSSAASVLVHGQIANSREKKPSSISKHFISWLKFGTEEKCLVCMLVSAFTAEAPSQNGLPVMKISLHMIEQVQPTCIQIIRNEWSDFCYPSVCTYHSMHRSLDHNKFVSSVLLSTQVSFSGFASL